MHRKFILLVMGYRRKIQPSEYLEYYTRGAPRNIPIKQSPSEISRQQAYRLIKENTATATNKCPHYTGYGHE